ncbi:hypothetical protein XENOCAPTIV_002903 [Xenoophorus captivus]|uniref:Secreted protein n=1 Tax=Xenoophorus captivus TaxID=1517983 RepID=A0ABV0RPW1_9TELE
MHVNLHVNFRVLVLTLTAFGSRRRTRVTFTEYPGLYRTSHQHKSMQCWWDSTRTVCFCKVQGDDCDPYRACFGNPRLSSVAGFKPEVSIMRFGSSKLDAMVFNW